MAFVFCASSSARAQEVILRGPLAGAPARTPHWMRAQRLELALTPGASFGSNDKPSLLAGAEAHYFLWDRLGLGAWGTAAFPVGSGESALRGALAPELVLVPLEGKANAFDQDYFPIDLHLLGGPALALAKQGGGEEASWLPMFGVGFRGFSANFFSNSLDYRLLFGDPVRHLVTLSFAFWPIERRLKE